MFIQQPFRIQAEPLIPQQVPVLMDNAIRMHFLNKAKEYSGDVVRIHRVELVNPVLVEDATQVEVMLSVEADTIEFFDMFIQSFIRDEETASMVIRPIR